MKANNWFKSWLEQLIVLIICIVTVSIFYHHVFFSPNNYMFSNRGDGIKNYFTYNYYIVNNKSMTNFEGFNYPYGESVFYTDGHPLLSFILKQIERSFPSLIDYNIGILNFLMILSLVLSGYIFYNIFRLFNLPGWFSIINSVPLIVMAPQIWRFAGHYALSYAIAIPLGIYFLIKSEKTNKLKYSVFQLINVSFWYLTHAYLGMMVSLFVIAYFVIKYCADFKKQVYERKFYISLILQGLLPLILFRVIVFLFDNHNSRTNNPYGFLSYKAELADFLLPNSKPLEIIYQWIKSKPDFNWESLAYIGLGTTLVLVILIVNMFIRKRRKQLFLNLNNDDKIINKLFIASIMVLLFAMAVPFRYNLEILLEWFPAFKQFRAVGRFDWVFFYICALFTTFFLYKLCQLVNGKILVLVLIVIIPIANIGSTYRTSKMVGKLISQTPNYFNADQLPAYMTKALSAVNYDSYQAIISIPYYFNGGDNYLKDAPDEADLNSTIISYYSKLPIMGSNLTRNSMWEARRLFQYIGPSWIKKEVITDISKHTDFLIIRSPGEIDQYEQEILQRSTVLLVSPEIELYKISYDSLFLYNPEMRIEQFIRDSSKLISYNGMLCSDTTHKFIYMDFENDSTEVAQNSKGALICKMNGYNRMIEIHANQLDRSIDYVISFWFYNQGPNYGQDKSNFGVYIYEKTSTGVINKLAYSSANGSRLINHDWTLIEIPITLSPYADQLRIETNGPKYPKQNIIVDNLLIYKKEEQFYNIVKQNEKSEIIVLSNNNHLYQLEP